MTTTFSVENWKDILPEAQPLWIPHYEEVGQDKIHMQLDPDIGRLNSLDAQGKLHIVAARRNGELIGYHASIIDRSLHYKNILVGASDLYWIRKDCRNGSAPLRLFQEVERTSKQRGVQVLYDATKLYLDHDRLFQYLGYKPIERKYSKWIGD